MRANWIGCFVLMLDDTDCTSSSQKKPLLSRWKLRWCVERSWQPSRGGSRHQGELHRPGRADSHDEDEDDVEDEEDVEDEDNVEEMDLV